MPKIQQKLSQQFHLNGQYRGRTHKSAYLIKIGIKKMPFEKRKAFFCFYQKQTIDYKPDFEL